MLYFSIITALLHLLPLPVLSHPHTTTSTPSPTPHCNITLPLFAELEELSRIVDISYCVGTSGISAPFLCASRCTDFPSFELVSTFNTGPLMSDSCGYIALDHGKKRIIVAFRGTYSIANTIVDLSTVPQEYVPYPEKPDDGQDPSKKEKQEWTLWDLIPKFRMGGTKSEGGTGRGPSVSRYVPPPCINCTVHSGFWTSWQNTSPLVKPHVLSLKKQHPEYALHLVGHSLGGAVAGLAGLEFQGLLLNPWVTTFGEPKVGNKGLRNYIDWTFNLKENGSQMTNGDDRYRRITHVDDPVPLLPLREWGYLPHAGEVYISKASLQPTVEDLRWCLGDEDTECIAGAEASESWFDESLRTLLSVNDPDALADGAEGDEVEIARLGKRWGIPIPARYKIWQLFFAHRDYFWRLGLCVPGGDPYDWGRDKYQFGEGDRGREL